MSIMLKTMQTLSLIVTVLLISVVMQGCAYASNPVSGRVVDADTNQPVGGAYVYARSGYYKCGPTELGGCGCINVDAAVTRTNSQGYYTFDKKFKYGGSFFSDKFGTVAVYKSGYFSSKDNSDLRNYAGNFRDLYHQYFTGSGKYKNSFKRYALGARRAPYALTRKMAKSIKDNFKNEASLRSVFIENILTGFGGPACVKSSRIVQEKSEMVRKAMCDEARGLSRQTNISQVLEKLCRL